MIVRPDAERDLLGKHRRGRGLDAAPRLCAAFCRCAAANRRKAAAAPPTASASAPVGPGSSQSAWNCRPHHCIPGLALGRPSCFGLALGRPNPEANDRQRLVVRPSSCVSGDGSVSFTASVMLRNVSDSGRCAGRERDCRSGAERARESRYCPAPPTAVLSARSDRSREPAHWAGSVSLR